MRFAALGAWQHLFPSLVCGEGESSAEASSTARPVCEEHAINTTSHFRSITPSLVEWAVPSNVEHTS